MIHLFLAGGWVMYPLLACSILAVAIIAEKAWVLRVGRVVPSELVAAFLKQVAGQSSVRFGSWASQTLLGRMLYQGLEQSEQGSLAMRLKMEDYGRQAIIELERYLNTLGTIVSTAPLLGLLGTVLGMIQLFAVLGGEPHPQALAAGISQALLTTAFGLIIAIPSLICHRYFRRRVDEFVLKLEMEGQKLIEGLKVIVPDGVSVHKNEIRK